VAVFDGKGLATTGTAAAPLESFDAGPFWFQGGIRVSVEDDTDNGNAAFVVTGVGPGGLPEINRYAANALYQGDFTPAAVLYADPFTFYGGLFVAGNVVF
jgi:hypothetical protein